MKTTIWIALCLVPVAGILSFNLETVDDHRGEWAEADNIAEMQATAAGTERRRVAEQRLCNALHGPNSELRYTDDGDTVCTTKRRLVPLVKP